MIYDRRLRAALIALLLTFFGTVNAFAVVDRAVCSSSDPGGATCNVAQLKAAINEEVNAVDNRAPMDLTSVSGTNTYVGSVTPTLTSYTGPQAFWLKVPNANTGASTLNINTIGAKALVSASGGALGSGDLLATNIYLVRYFATGDHFRVLTNLGTGTSLAGNDYVTVGNTAALSAERAITAGRGLNFIDAGANSTYTLILKYGDTLASNPVLTANGCVFSNEGAGGGLICEGSVDDDFEGNFKVPDVTGADNTQTFLTDASAAGGDLTGTYPNPLVAANAVALTTDTTGNYAAGDAEAGAALTGDSASSFFTAGSLEVARGGNGGAPASDDQTIVSSSTSAAAWLTLPDTDGAGLKLVYDQTTNAFSAGTDDDVPDAADFGALALTGDVTSAGLAATIAANAVALTSDTTGNYMSDIAAGVGISVTHTPAEGSTGTVALSYADQGASPALAADACQFTSNATVGGFIVCEGDTADAFETRVVITDPTADRAFTIPNADSAAVQPVTCGGTDKVSAISALGVVTCTADDGGAGAGDNITINGAAAANADFDDADPAAVSGANVLWQLNTTPSPDSVSAYVPLASTSVIGVAQHATDAETLTGTSTTKTLTPSNLKAAAMTRITSGNFTAVAGVAITGLSGYRYLELHINGYRPADDATWLQLFFSNDGGSTFTAGNFSRGMISVTSGTTVAGDSDSIVAQDSTAISHGDIGNAAGEGLWAIVKIGNFNVAGQKPVNSVSQQIKADGTLQSAINFSYDQASIAMDAFKLQPSAGNIAAVGTYDLYGIP